MDIKRHVYQTLLKWKNDNCHTTLEVNGARQVGKTYIINKFADENFSHKVYINLFELSGEQFISCYQKACNWRPGEGPRPQAPLHDAFRLFDENFSDTEDTVIIIDEIQESAEIYNRIREFTRQFRCRFIVTGSYLGRIYEPEFRYSSGDVTSIQIYTLSYEEFLEAADTDLYEKYKLHGKNTGVYCFVIEGEVEIGNTTLSRRDGMGIYDTKSFELETLKDSHILLIEVPM